MESPATAPEISLMEGVWYILAPHWLTQSGRLRCSVAAISLSEDTEVIETVGLAEIPLGVNGARSCCRLV